MKTPELILMADATEALAARLGVGGEPGKAAEVAALLIRLSVELAASYWPGEISLYGPPGDPHPLYRELAGEFHLRLAIQAVGDPGRAMHAALCEGISRCAAAAVLGCAVPHLPGTVLEDAFEHLARGRSVLGPSDNGGYYLIGLQAPCAGLFQGIDWGGRTVLAETLDRAGTEELVFEYLPTERAIERWDDLYLASRRLEILQRYV